MLLVCSCFSKGCRIVNVHRMRGVRYLWFHRYFLKMLYKYTIDNYITFISRYVNFALLNIYILVIEMSGEHPNACSPPCSFKFATLHLNPSTILFVAKQRRTIICWDNLSSNPTGGNFYNSFIYLYVFFIHDTFGSSSLYILVCNF